MKKSFSELPSGHQTMLLAHRAMTTDLPRIAEAATQLARTPDPLRALALSDYIDRVHDLIAHHHEGEDAYLWPTLRKRGGDESAIALLTAEHRELDKFLGEWQQVARRLRTDSGVATELARISLEVHDRIVAHAGDEETELATRLAPVLDKSVWKGFETHMRKTAPGWTLRFMPAWLLGVAQPGELTGVPALPVARLFRGWLQRQQRAALG